MYAPKTGGNNAEDDAIGSKQIPRFCTISGTCSTMIIKQLGVNAMYVDSLLQHIDISSMIHASAKAK
jgi:hypothetical protein